MMSNPTLTPSPFTGRDGEGLAMTTDERRDEMIFQDAPANTLNYMIAGYAVIFGVMLAYGISLFVRWHNLKRDEAALEEMEKEG